MRSRIGRGLLLLALLGVAATLRFSGLAWGLRHVPDMDERYFVENVQIMIAHRDLDHRYYEYPGLFFYLLTPAVALAGNDLTRAYLLARGMVASIGVLNVLVVYLVGQRIAGRTPALVAALLLAVSPVEVATAHMIRADVVLATLVLLAIDRLRRLDGSLRADARAGAVLGAALALKFTGVLLAPCYVIARFLAGGRRMRGGLIALLTAALAFVLLSPYAVIHAGAFFEGAGTQVLYHYEAEPTGPSLIFGMLGLYASVWPEAFGWPGVALALIGLALAVRRWRTWLPLLPLPLLTLAVFSTQPFHFDRHMVPSLGIVALLSGLGLTALTRDRPWLTGFLAALTAALPFSASLAYVREISRPGTRDVAVDWIHAHVPQGARIVSAVPGLGIDRNRIEVLEIPLLAPWNLVQVLNADAVVSTTAPRNEAVLRDLPVAFSAVPDSPVAGAPIRIRLVPPARRPPYVRVPLGRARLWAPGHAELLDAVRDGRIETRFESLPQRGKGALRVELHEPFSLARIEVFLGKEPARDIRLAVSPDGVAWIRPRVLPGRPSPAHQLGPPSRMLLFDPIRVRIVRLFPAGKGSHPWRIAELRFDALPESPTVKRSRE